MHLHIIYNATLRQTTRAEVPIYTDIYRGTEIYRYIPRYRNIPIYTDTYRGNKTSDAEANHKGKDNTRLPHLCGLVQSLALGKLT
jgi:hypothetical protein